MDGYGNTRGRGSRGGRTHSNARGGGGRGYGSDDRQPPNRQQASDRRTFGDQRRSGDPASGFPHPNYPDGSGNTRGRGGRTQSRGRGYGSYEHQPPNRHPQTQQQVSPSLGEQPLNNPPSRGWEKPAPSPHPQLSSVPDIQSLSITQKSPVDVQDCRGQMVPIRRPDSGGQAAKTSTTIIANHFPVRYSGSIVMGHYDIGIKPLQQSNRPVIKLKKSHFRLIRDQLSKNEPHQFPLSRTGYDGERNLYSCVELPCGEFKVKFSEAEDREGNEYIVKVKLVNQFDLSMPMIPRHVMQGLDVVTKEHPARHLIISGGSFFSPEFNASDNIGNGIIASSGFQHSLKLTSQGLALCVDYSVVPFRKPIGVIEFLQESLRGINLSDFRSSKKDVENVLIGLKVHVTHRQTSQKYTIRELTNKNTRQLTFQLMDPSGTSQQCVFLTDYFKDKYGWEVQHLDIPCLELGRKDKPNQVPMECCKIVPGQRIPKDWLGTDSARKLKDKSIVPPSIRMSKINGMLQWENGPCGGDVIGNFGIEVDRRMSKVKGRVIGSPELKIGGPQGRPSKVMVDRERCQWNLGGKCVLEGKSIDRWAVINFSDKFGGLDANMFIPSLIDRCMNLRIHLDVNPVYESARMDVLSSAQGLRSLLERISRRTEAERKGKPQIIVCAMTKRHDGYKLLKWISETEIGTITQCCLSGPANKANDQYLANLAMKMNAKLGGSNMELLNHLPRFEREKHVMLVGADVNHPSSNDVTVPSIAAVVATMNWPGANKYAARVRAQTHRCEKILNFSDMCLDLVKTYEGINSARPDRIVIFRDGVSESQFDMVLNQELADLKRVFKMQGYTPTITLIVARKRHLTRLFLEDTREGSRNANISPGTVVDTTIVHPSEFDFYLCSHHGVIGTSKPTHYHVLYDDHRFSSDDLQKFIYFVCFTFARCTKPVSLVTPVYYADLVAYRGRLYYEASQNTGFIGSASSSRSSSSAAPSVTIFNEQLMKLHSNLENSMFFI
uniref:Argonaute 2 n=1 Tax=Kalanchoe fedtschenkoi TaxID=63787 RepID=A0A7N0UAI9_KALFE